jgi:hypothetical protein
LYHALKLSFQAAMMLKSLGVAKNVKVRLGCSRYIKNSDVEIAQIFGKYEKYFQTCKK